MKKLTIRVDNEELHQAFKINCIKNNTNMQEEIIRLMEESLKNESKEMQI